MPFYRFAAIYKSDIYQGPPTKAIIDPVKVELFPGPRTFRVFEQHVKAVIPGNHQGPIATDHELTLPNGDHFISLIARTKQDSPLEAKRHCESSIDSAIAVLSVLYDPDLFSRQVYRGWIFSEEGFIAEAWVCRRNVIKFDRPFLELTATDIRAHLSKDPDLLRRWELMARFYSKSLIYSPSEEQFLLLWTVLEIFPMKGTSDIRPLSDYFSRILSRPADEVKAKLRFGKLYGFRSDLVHDGRLEIPTRETGEWFGLLESIVLEVFRTMAGQPYSGSLDRFFK